MATRKKADSAPADSEPAPFRNTDGSLPGTVVHATLAAAVCGVMTEVEAVRKTGTLEVGGGKRVSIAGIEAISEHLQRMMARHGLCILPLGADSVVHEAYTTRSGNTMFRTDLTMRALLMHRDSSETQEVGMAGQGCDTGDKGVYKAASGAQKYLLRWLFLLVTTDQDPDATHPEPGKVVDAHNPNPGWVPERPQEPSQPPASQPPTSRPQDAVAPPYKPRVPASRELERKLHLALQVYAKGQPDFDYRQSLEKFSAFKGKHAESLEHLCRSGKWAGATYNEVKKQLIGIMGEESYEQVMADGLEPPKEKPKDEPPVPSDEELF